MNWYIKEFAKITKISVRTLHHYDEIGLLKPSLRSQSDYRLYSETDLIRLQQITALKFFGLSLKQIKELLKNSEDIMSHLKKQQECLMKQITQLQSANQTIDTLLAESTDSKIPDWSKIIKLMEEYRMSENLRNSWISKAFSPDQIAQFAELKKRYTEKEMDEIGKKWDLIIEKVKSNLDKDPHSAIGQQLAEEWMNWLNTVYGDYPELKDALSLAYKYNKIPRAPFDQKLWDFIGKAVKYMEQNKK